MAQHNIIAAAVALLLCLQVFSAAFPQQQEPQNPQQQQPSSPQPEEEAAVTAATEKTPEGPKIPATRPPAKPEGIPSTLPPVLHSTETTGNSQNNTKSGKNSAVPVQATFGFLVASISTILLCHLF